VDDALIRRGCKWEYRSHDDDDSDGGGFCRNNSDNVREIRCDGCTNDTIRNCASLNEEEDRCDDDDGCGGGILL
jgi:hypothetical protein